MFKIKNVNDGTYFKDFSLSGFVNKQSAKSFKTEAEAKKVLIDLEHAGYLNLRIERQ